MKKSGVNMTLKGYKEIQNMDKVSENLIEKANLYYRKAKTLYSQKKFWEACQSFGRGGEE